MKITQIKTQKIVPGGGSITEFLDKNLSQIRDRSILAITSKVISICEGQVVPIGSIDKQRLVEREADYYLSPHQNSYDISLTIKNGVLIPSAGVDESNGNGYYILWPKNPQKTVNNIRTYLVKRFSVEHIGVIITDSKTTPLRWGTTGITIAHSGFVALKDYIGKPDIFGKKLQVTKANIMDGLAAAAVLVMGEGAEQTPLAVIEKVPFVKFQRRNPTTKELKQLRIDIKDDLYAQMLKGVRWKSNKKSRLTFV